MIAKLNCKRKDRDEAIAIGKGPFESFISAESTPQFPSISICCTTNNFCLGKYDLTYIDKLISDGCQFSL